MPEQRFILAHDLGTTGDKATLFDAVETRPVSSVTEPYETSYPRPNWAEQNPQDWQRAFIRCTQRLLQQSSIRPANITAVSFSGHMQCALVVDRTGEPLHPAIIWADQRATQQADSIRREFGEDYLYRLTGHRISPAYTAAKLLWLKDHEPEVFSKIGQVLQPKDYLAFLLTGAFATDFSDASGTQLFDLTGRRWAEDLIREVGLDPDAFPPATASATVIGGVSAQAARATGLLKGTPVVIGGGDGACATVGAGSVQEGDSYAYIGSSAWIALTARQPIFDPQRRTFNFAHLDPDLYFPIGTMQAAGGSYGWLEALYRRDQAGHSHLEAMDSAAQSVPPGANGLLFLPYLLGERSPYWNPFARAAFIGLAMSHGWAELSRAVLEGVAFNLRLILDVLRAQGIRIEAMRLIGGGARSSLWRQILADVFQLPIHLPALPMEATALGAVIAGGVGVGLFPDYRVAATLIPAKEAELPDHGNRRRYDELYQLFQQAYLALEPVFARLASAETG